MQESVTREEVNAVISAQVKVAEQLTIIASALQTQNSQQQKILELQQQVANKVSNGMGSAIDKILDRQSYIVYAMTFTVVVAGFIGGAKLLAWVGILVR